MFLGLKEVAKRLDISYYAVIENYVKKGKLKSIKLDGMYKVDEKDLEEFIKSREVVVK
jgi:predicted site-specific integrase-resolvase